MSRRVVTEYMAGRLTFKRDVIEALMDSDCFRIITPQGTFEMSKAEVYASFPSVVRSRSYRESGVYHYPRVPRAAEPFRVDE
jgi:hypothetical protein